jgi:ketosteroid isomerase-like protein
MHTGEVTMKLSLLIASLLIVGLNLSAAHADDALSVLQDTGKAWETAYNAGNSNGVAALYADEATFNSGVLGALKGKAAIEKAVAEQMKKTPTIKVTPQEAHMRGDVLWGFGDFTLANGPSGHYGMTMVKDTTGWRIVMHVSNVTPP